MRASRHARGAADRLRSLCRQHRRRDHGPGNGEVDGKKIQQAQAHLGLKWGMMSEENIDFLRERSARYMVGTPKSHLKRFETNCWSKRIGKKCSPESKSSWWSIPTADRGTIYALPLERAAGEGTRHARRPSLASAHSAGQNAREPKASSPQGSRPDRTPHWALAGAFAAAERLLEVEVQRDPDGRACGLKILERGEHSAWAPHAQGAYMFDQLYGAGSAKLWRWYIQLRQADGPFASARAI